MSATILPPHALPPVSLDEQLAAAKREVNKRLQVYPRLVTEGRMAPRKANHEIAAMQSIVATLERVVAGEARLL